MRSINGAVLRSAFAMVLGFVLVLWPEAAITYLVITIGILFILPGLFAILSYFTRPKNENGEKPMFPIEAAGSVLFGAWLVIMPEFFVNILMYLLGALLVIAGVQQLVSLISARKWSNVPLGFYLDAGFDLDNRSNDSCLPVRGGGKYIRNLRCSQHFLRGL